MKVHPVNLASIKSCQKVVKNIIPERIQVDNRSEFISKELDRWAYDKVALVFSRSGKPTENPFKELFNGSIRDECLNVNWFLPTEMLMKKCIEEGEYSHYRPHSSLGGMAPQKYYKYIKKRLWPLLFSYTMLVRGSVVHPTLAVAYKYKYLLLY